MSVSAPTPTTLGLIAGGGALPLLQAAGMRAGGHRVVAVGFHGVHDPALPALCDSFRAVSPLRTGSWVRHLRNAGADRAVMVGHFPKSLMFKKREAFALIPDWTTLRLWFWDARHDRRSQRILSLLADTLAARGLPLVDTTAHIPDHLAHEGPMTKRPLSARQQADLALAIPILQALNALDVGQGLVIREGDVVALEAMEGTDHMIRRAGAIARKDWMLVKGCGKAKDLRFDVPTVGVQTIENIAKAGGSALALVAGRTILVDKPEVLAAAERLGVAVFGFRMD